MKPKTDDIIAAISAVHAAHTNALVVLVKTLQEAGVLKPSEYATNIRMTIDANRDAIGPNIQRLLLELATLVDDDGTPAEMQ